MKRTRDVRVIQGDPLDCERNAIRRQAEDLWTRPEQGGPR